MKTQIQLLNADCISEMKKFPDKYFDLAVVDPPYGIGAGNKNFQNGTRNRKAEFFRKNDWDSEIPNEEYFFELFRVSKNQIIWGGNYFTEFLRPSKSWIFWDKLNGENSYSDGELAWTSFEKVLKKYSKFWAGAQAKEKNEKDRMHPTQKPVSLYEWIFQNYSNQGERILDTHLGSGSSAIAAERFGLDFLGIEIDPEYFQKTKNRFELSTSQKRIF
jgi:site-specific DNA-methyltransferase (adenine-specific)